MNQHKDEHEITEEVISAAQKNPNGWVYKIEGNFGSDERVPPECVVGAWKVDASGKLTGEFVKNKNYQPGFSKITRPGLHNCIISQVKERQIES